ncbi:MAG: DUF4275 family protein [Alphaproteobacteria bacterium]|nr:DUF4275 family protein [Alphaproteobacteria bacterium]
MRSHYADYSDLLDACGGRRDVLETRFRWQALQAWRHVYAARLHAGTGKWTWRGFDWHVFSYRYAPALHGERAAIAYAALDAPPAFFVCPQNDDARSPAFRIEGGTLPDLRPIRWDILVWSEDFDWTMAFTHEDGFCGPYFSRREWVAPYH